MLYILDTIYYYIITITIIIVIVPLLYASTWLPATCYYTNSIGCFFSPYIYNIIRTTSDYIV